MQFSRWQIAWNISWRMAWRWALIFAVPTLVLLAFNAIAWASKALSSGSGFGQQGGLFSDIATACALFIALMSLPGVLMAAAVGGWAALRPQIVTHAEAEHALRWRAIVLCSIAFYSPAVIALAGGDTISFGITLVCSTAAVCVFSALAVVAVEPAAAWCREHLPQRKRKAKPQA